MGTDDVYQSIVTRCTSGMNWIATNHDLVYGGRWILRGLLGVILLVIGGCDLIGGDQLTASRQNDLEEFQRAGQVVFHIDHERIYQSRKPIGPYRVGCGDLLKLQMPTVVRSVSTDLAESGRIDRMETVLSRVDDDGDISLPIVGEHRIQGLTLPEIETAIQQLYYPRYVVCPPVVVTQIEDYHKPQVTITGAVVKSGRYALRRDQMTLVSALMEAGGILETGAAVIPNMIEPAAPASGPGSIVGFIGRLSPEKGVDTLLAAAKLLPEIPFAAAGSFQAMPDLPGRLPINLRLLGAIEPAGISDFYNRCRFTLLPSVCLEGFPSTILESMIRGLPVIASRIGAIPEIVQENKTGLLFDPFDPRDLTEKIRRLWNNPNLCRHLGRNARQIAMRDYNPEIYYAKLMGIYETITPITDQSYPGDLSMPTCHEFAENK